MSTTRTTEPTTMTQGDRVTWTRTISSYSAVDYTLEYRFRSQAGPGFNVTADDDGSEFVAEITSAQSLAAKSGTYKWQAWLTEIADTDHTFAIQVGELRITPGFTTDAKGIVDLRSDAKKMLDTLDAALLQTGEVLRYEITTAAGTRKVERSSRTEVLKLRETFVKIVRRENLRDKIANGGTLMTPVNVRYKDA